MLGWVLFGYYIWLFLLGILRKDDVPVPGNLEKYPFISLIIATHNEEDFILKKIDNLKLLDYPRDKLEIIFVDGGSDDMTGEIIQKHKVAHMEFLKSPYSGKINQLNFALKHCKGEFIFISDADSLMSSNSIKECLKEFARDENIYVTGIYSYPKTTYNIDSYYWVTQNKGRLLETQAFTSSIVIAVSYSFRKDLINEFPQDVVADDVYISYLANSLGYRVAYIDRCHAEELRGPRNIKEFLGHKYRKSNAFLRESLRFIYKTSEMNTTWKIMFLTKISQMVLVPWLFFSYIILGGALITLKRWDVFFLGSIFLLVLIVITQKFFSLTKKEESSSLIIMAKTFLLSIFILFITGITFIFYRQDSNYKKIKVT